LKSTWIETAATAAAAAAVVVVVIIVIVVVVVVVIVTSKLSHLRTIIASFLSHEFFFVVF
jgi:hypothetical protein